MFKSSRQQRYLEACLNPDVPATVIARCKYAGINRQTYYLWYKNSDFKDWLVTETGKAIKEELREVWQAILKSAREGNVPAQKLFLERFDPEYISKTAKRGGVQVNILSSGPTAIEVKSESIRALLAEIEQAAKDI